MASSAGSNKGSQYKIIVDSSMYNETSGGGENASQIPSTTPSAAGMRTTSTNSKSATRGNDSSNNNNNNNNERQPHRQQQQQQQQQQRNHNSSTTSSSSSTTSSNNNNSNNKVRPSTRGHNEGRGNRGNIRRSGDHEGKLSANKKEKKMKKNKKKENKKKNRHHDPESHTSSVAAAAPQIMRSESQSRSQSQSRTEPSSSMSHRSGSTSSTTTNNSSNNNNNNNSSNSSSTSGREMPNEEVEYNNNNNNVYSSNNNNYDDDSDSDDGSQYSGSDSYDSGSYDSGSGSGSSLSDSASRNSRRLEQHSPRNQHGDDEDNEVAMSRVIEDLLDVDGFVNPVKLREAARLGIPKTYRNLVYRYLLGTAYVDKSVEMTMERMQEKDFIALLATYSKYWESGGAAANGRGGGGGGGVSNPSGVGVGGSGSANTGGDGTGGGGAAGAALGLDSRVFRESNATPITRRESPYANSYRCGERATADGSVAWSKLLDTRVKRHPRFESNPEGRHGFESALRALQIAHPTASAEDIDLFFTFALAFEGIFTSNAKDLFFAVEAVLHVLTHHGNILQDMKCMQRHCGTFLMLFHVTNATLYQHFFQVGVTAMEWVPGMLTTLLAGNLHHEDLWTLWDVYFADAFDALGFPLHMYVCLALINELSEELVEMDKSGIAWRLKNLPRVNMRRLLRKAMTLRESVISRGLLVPDIHVVK